MSLPGKWHLFIGRQSGSHCGSDCLRQWRSYQHPSSSLGSRCAQKPPSRYPAVRCYLTSRDHHHSQVRDCSQMTPIRSSRSFWARRHVGHHLQHQQLFQFGPSVSPLVDETPEPGANTRILPGAADQCRKPRRFNQTSVTELVVVIMPKYTAPARWCTGRIGWYWRNLCSMPGAKIDCQIEAKRYSPKSFGTFAVHGAVRPIAL